MKRRLAFTFEAHYRSVYCVAFSPDGALVASGDGEDDEKPGRLLVWEAATGRIVQDIGRFPWSIASVAWSPDGERVASEVRLWPFRHAELLGCTALP